jgi:chemotaxis receptor (MCP) glutamine deamidase CheD
MRGVLHPDPRIVEVPPDHFEVAADDVLFTALLDGTLAVCLYDAVEEHGALLHLRFIARGSSQTDVTDRTLASDLLLLDRCVETFRGAMERGIDVQGKIAASVETGEPARQAAAAVLALIGEYLIDAGVRIVSHEVEHGATRSLRFRPSMGQLRLD